MAVVYIGNYTDDTIYRMITDSHTHELSQAARLFQERLLTNMPTNIDTDCLISVLPKAPVGIMPEETILAGKKITNIYYKKNKYFTFFSAMKKIYGIIKNAIDKNESTDRVSVLMYAVNVLALVPLLVLRKNRNFDLVTICPELPEYRRYGNGTIDKIKKKTYTYLNQKFDKYILFAENMVEYIPKKRPFLVVEGFAPEAISNYQKKEKNIAMYAGGLAFDNGIKMMIKAAHLSEYIDELWICGVGEGLEYVKDHVDEKVKYLGRLSNSEVVDYERQAKVLLNVRDPRNELTAFSFPSKILEYMAAQGVVISSDLKGIPDEYNSHIVVLSEYSAEALAQKMDDIFLLKDSELCRISEKNTSFLINKTAHIRCQEVKKFIEQ